MSNPIVAIPDYTIESDKVLVVVEKYIEDWIEWQFAPEGPMKKIRERRWKSARYALLLALNYGVSQVGNHLLKKATTPKGHDDLWVGPLRRQYTPDCSKLYTYDSVVGTKKKAKTYNRHWREGVEFKFDTSKWGLTHSMDLKEPLPQVGPSTTEKITFPEIDYRGKGVPTAMQWRNWATGLASEIDKYINRLSKSENIDNVLTNVEREYGVTPSKEGK